MTQASDRDFLLRIINSEMSRRMAWDHHLITSTEHARWLEQKLASSEDLLFIIQEDACPIGSCRLSFPKSIPAGTAEVSITIAPDSQGAKKSVEALMALANEAKSRGFQTLCASIRPENERASRAFLEAGFLEQARRFARDLT